MLEIDPLFFDGHRYECFACEDYEYNYCMSKSNNYQFVYEKDIFFNVKSWDDRF
jgi:hypothetical protein